MPEDTDTKDAHKPKNLIASWKQSGEIKTGFEDVLFTNASEINTEQRIENFTKYWFSEKGRSEVAALTAICIESVWPNIKAVTKKDYVATISDIDIEIQEDIKTALLEWGKPIYDSIGTARNTLEEKAYDELRGMLETAKSLNMPNISDDLPVENLLFIGLQTASKVSLHAISIAPDLYQDKFKKDPTKNELLAICKNSDSLITILSSHHLNVGVPFFKELNKDFFELRKDSTPKIEGTPWRIALSQKGHEKLKELVQNWQKDKEELPALTKCFALASDVGGIDAVESFWQEIICEQVAPTIYDKFAKSV